MSAVDSLMQRVEAEFDAAKKRVAEFQQKKVEEYQDRQKRLESFSQACDHLRDIWRPRLEALAKRFGEKVKVTPTVTPSARQAVMHFHSQFAKIVLTFAATTDPDVRNLVLRYDLEILPILMKFKNADKLEMPLDKIDREKIGAWIDDRIVDFVQAFLDLHQNEHYLSYLKDYTVEDPIARVKFPKYAAAAKCDWKGETYYFVGAETLDEFRKKNGIAG